MICDALLCVGDRHKKIALKAIRSLRLFAGCSRIFVVTSRQNFPYFERYLAEENSLRLLDEDRIASGLNLNVVKEILYQRIGSADRAGWYFQQFLKMSMSHHPEITDHYLVWDGDTIMLKGLDFFSAGKVLVTPKEEFHQPYFKTIKKLLGLERQVDYSFVAEHLMVNSSYMRELIAELSSKDDGEGRIPWFERVLDKIDDNDLKGAGFSEYETYGNFLASRHPDSFECRTVKSLRISAFYYGQDPDKYDLARLMHLGHDYATFETYLCENRVRIAKNKALSRIRNLYYRQTGVGRERLYYAGLICGDDMEG